jgi:hypothetical protein
MRLYYKPFIIFISQYIRQKAIKFIPIVISLLEAYLIKKVSQPLELPTQENVLPKNETKTDSIEEIKSETNTLPLNQNNTNSINAKIDDSVETLLLERMVFGAAFTIGIITHNGKYVCHTLEDKDRYLEKGTMKIYSQTAIPRGEYEVDISFSPKFKVNLPEILNVPQFSGIRIHVGSNIVSDKDTSGCIIPCFIVNKKTTDSLKAFNVLNKLIWDLLKNKKLKIKIK